MAEIAELAAGILALPGRSRGAQTLAQALRVPLLAALLWRVLRDEAVVGFADRASLDDAMKDLLCADTILPAAPPATLLVLCGPACPVLTLALNGQGDLAQVVFGGVDG
jgi:hypothetical protein